MEDEMSYVIGDKFAMISYTMEWNEFVKCSWNKDAKMCIRRISWLFGKNSWN